MATLIKNSVKQTIISFTYGCKDAREMLLNLKAQFCANPTVRKRRLVQEYRDACKITETANINTWIQSWEIAYQRCREVKAPEVDGDKPLFDIVLALQERVPSFYSNWYFRILREGDSLRIRDLIQELKDYLRDARNTNTAVGSKSHNTAFSATLQGNAPDTQNQALNQGNTPSTNRRPNRPTRPTPKCICGQVHWYGDCPYLSSSAQTPGWRPDLTIQKAIETRLANDPKLRFNVEKAKLKRATMSTTQSDTASRPSPKSDDDLAKVFYAQNPSPAPEPYPYSPRAFTATELNPARFGLYNSFILDSGATNHICHTKDRFTNYRPNTSTLIAGAGPMTVYGYGDVEIMVQGTHGPRKVTLKDTSYIPDFQANIVSMKRIRRAGIHWDQLTNQLVQGDKTFCTVIERDDLWVLEENPVSAQEAAFLAQKYTKTTAPKPDQQVTLETLHRRFAHAGIEAIRRLPESTHGINITDPETRNIHCEICPQTKGKKLIHREPTQPPRAPYEVVSFDFFELKLVEEDAGSGKYVLHFYCRYTGMNHVYVLPNKRQETLLRTIRAFVQFVKTRWNLTVSLNVHGHREIPRGYG